MITKIAKARIARRKAAAAVAQFQRTGILPKLLLTHFDQTGKLISEDICTSGLDRDSCRLLSTIKLPCDQTVIRNKRGYLVLLTSYLWHHKDQPAELPWCQINGDIFVNNCPEINAPSLRAINGNAEIFNTRIHMPHLEFVRSLWLGKFEEVCLPRLRTTRGLESFVKRLDLPRLQNIYGDLYAHGATHVTAPKLRQVSGTLSTLSADVAFHHDIEAHLWIIFDDAKEQWRRWIRDKEESERKKQLIRKTLRELPPLEI